MKTILIVDDEPEYLDELAEALAFHDIASTAVGSGAEALRTLAEDGSISTVLTDIRMPDMDGVALVEATRRIFPDRRLSFLVMTGHAAAEDIARAHAAGVSQCFPKPLPFDKLCEALVALASPSRGEAHP